MKTRNPAFLKQYKVVLENVYKNCCVNYSFKNFPLTDGFQKNKFQKEN